MNGSATRQELANTTAALFLGELPAREADTLSRAMQAADEKVLADALLIAANAVRAHMEGRR